jgi:3-deoxy-D-manno-octulosonic-acid transferase
MYSFFDRAVLWVYGLAWWLLTPLIATYLWWRSRKNPEYKKHWRQRWGLEMGTRLGAHPSAKLIWIHAVSLGETLAVKPLLLALAKQYPQHNFLLTHMTPTGLQAGADLAKQLPAGRVMQQYLPYDYPQAQRKFLKAWQPVLGLMVETELWPQLTYQAHRLAIPMVLVNARLSEKSFAKAKRIKWLVEPALQSFSAVLAQTDVHAKRLNQLQANNVQVVGNLKYDVAINTEQLEAGGQLKRELAEATLNVARSIIALAVTREGEEILLAKEWIAQKQPNDLLLVIPRHPERFESVRLMLVGLGLKVVSKTSLMNVAQLADADVLLGDTMGQMPFYYGLADVCIMGGTILNFGGQNVIEPLACGCPVVVGGSTFNFEAVVEDASGAGAIEHALESKEATKIARGIVSDPIELGAMKIAGKLFLQNNLGASNNVIAFLRSILN